MDGELAVAPPVMVLLALLLGSVLLIPVRRVARRAGARLGFITNPYPASLALVALVGAAGIAAGAPPLVAGTIALGAGVVFLLTDRAVATSSTRAAERNSGSRMQGDGALMARDEGAGKPAQERRRSRAWQDPAVRWALLFLLALSVVLAVGVYWLALALGLPPALRFAALAFAVISVGYYGLEGLRNAWGKEPESGPN